MAIRLSGPSRRVAVLIVSMASLVLPSQAFAIAMYDSFIQLRVLSVFDPTTNVLNVGLVTLPPPVTLGNATAFNSGVANASDTAPFVNGSAQAPPSPSIGSSLAESFTSFTVTNSTPTATTIVLFVAWRLIASAGPGETASASMFYSVLIDGGSGGTFTDSVEVGPNDFQFSATTLLLNFPPGVHGLQMTSHAEGTAISGIEVAPIPEPATLVLLGTSGIALLLARRRHRGPRR